MKYPEDFINKIICSDCLEVMKIMPDNCIDTIITDPPYGLSFMGQKWDYDVPSIEIWQECLRLLKPGGTALIFAGSRTQHRMAVNIEDAGFILKDCIMWLYGSGFPKATDVSQMLDKCECRSRLTNILGRKPTKEEFQEAWEGKKCPFCGGIGKAINPDVKDPEFADYWLDKPCEKCNGSGMEQESFRKVVGQRDDILKKQAKDLREGRRKIVDSFNAGANERNNGFITVSADITVPTTLEAKLWNGWKSHGLKPSYEPILVCVKPNEGSYANNALKWGVAGLNIDRGRVEYQSKKDEYHRKNKTQKHGIWDNCSGELDRNSNTKGRYPANVILDEESARMLDEQSGMTSITGKRKDPLKSYRQPVGGEWFGRHNHNGAEYQDKGGASRFFYCAKASKSERNRGCEELEEKPAHDYGSVKKSKGRHGKNMPNANHHPTIKPLALMKYLCTLTKTPTGGVVLDPFAGSGTTLMACKELKRDYIGIDNNQEYCEIARKRVNSIPESLF